MAGSARTYREILTPISHTTTTNIYQISSHPGSALLLERFVFFDTGTTATILDGDLLRLVVILAPGVNSALTVAGNIILADASWNRGLAGGAITFDLNPEGKPGFNFAPPLRLAANDDPCFIVFSDNTGARMPATVNVTLLGWELTVPGLDRQYPAPDRTVTVI